MNRILSCLVLQLLLAGEFLIHSVTHSTEIDIVKIIFVMLDGVVATRASTVTYFKPAYLSEDRLSVCFQSLDA